jgi:hypothetical protein
MAAAHLVETFSRHLMMTFDSWQEQGFAAVAKTYLSRLAPGGEKGLRRDIDENGDLLLRRMGHADPERCRLASALKTPSWLDPHTRGPRA